MRLLPLHPLPLRFTQMLGCLLLLAGLILPLVAPAQAQGDPSFNLVNRSGQAIREIYVSPSEDRYWGHDLLQEAVLAPGRSFPLRLPTTAGCLQDVRVVYADGQPEERRRQDTCRMVEMVFGGGAAPRQGPPQAQGGNPSFNLVNHGSGVIREVYVSSAREDAWGEDRLGEQVLQPGRHLAVRLPSGDCVNDVRIVWMDGRNEERRRLDTCRVTNVIFQ